MQLKNNNPTNVIKTIHTTNQIKKHSVTECLYSFYKRAKAIVEIM